MLPACGLGHRLSSLSRSLEKAVSQGFHGSGRAAKIDINVGSTMTQMLLGTSASAEHRPLAGT